jgi:hypothetical protein
MRKTLALTALLMLLGAVGLAAPGAVEPAWQNTGDGRLVARLDVECTRFPAGNTVNYRFETVRRTAITATETDDGRNATVELVGTARVEMTRDAAGKTAVKVRIAKVLHVDLDADGTFDGFYDSAAHRTCIVLDGRAVVVEGSKRFLDDGAARSLDHKTDYVFERGKWKAR